MITVNDEAIQSMTSDGSRDTILMDEAIELFQSRIAPFQDARYNDRAIVLTAYIADNDLLMNVESIYPHFFTQLDALFFTRSLDTQDALASAYHFARTYVGPDAYDIRFKSEIYRKEVQNYIDFLSELV
jgi:hypothetical protein